MAKICKCIPPSLAYDMIPPYSALDLGLHDICSCCIWVLVLLWDELVGGTLYEHTLQRSHKGIKLPIHVNQ
jgi:hypothetical protein